MSFHLNVDVNMKDRETIRKALEISFHAGTLAALDVVYLHDQETIAAEIVNATDSETLLRWAEKDGYGNLAKLKATIREQNRRERIPSRGDSR